MSSFIHLTAKGEHKAGKIGDVSNGVEVMLGKIMKRTKDPQLIGSWVWQKYKLFLYGYKEGRAGTENKHDLPPPHDEVVLFGDACVIASLEKAADKPATFSVDQYKKFYNSKFGGFEDIVAAPAAVVGKGGAAAAAAAVVAGADDIEDAEEDVEDEDDDEDEEEEYDDDEGVGDDEVAPDIEGDQEDEDDEPARPVVRIKPSSTFKKVAKWMYLPELKADPYLL
jgi:hypothetical protein